MGRSCREFRAVAEAMKATHRRELLSYPIDGTSTERNINLMEGSMAGGSSQLIPTWSEIRKFHNIIVLLPLDKVAAHTVNLDRAAGSVPVSRWTAEARQPTVWVLQSDATRMASTACLLF